MPLIGSTTDTAACRTPGTRAAASPQPRRQLGPCLHRRASQLDPDGVQIIRVEAQIARRQRRERPAEERGHDDEHQRQRHLADHQRPGHRSAPGHAAVGGVADRVAGVDAARPPCGRQAERERGRDGEAGEEAEQPPVERQRERDRRLRRRELGHQEARAPHGERRARRPRPAGRARGSPRSVAGSAVHARRRGPAAPTARAAAPRRAPAAGWRRWRRRRAAPGRRSPSARAAARGSDAAASDIPVAAGDSSSGSFR